MEAKLDAAEKRVKEVIDRGTEAAAMTARVIYDIKQQLAARDARIAELEDRLRHADTALEKIGMGLIGFTDAGEPAWDVTVPGEISDAVTRLQREHDAEIVRLRAEVAEAKRRAVGEPIDEAPFTIEEG
jgi:hypothetical protein